MSLSQCSFTLTLINSERLMQVSQLLLYCHSKLLYSTAGNVTILRRMQLNVDSDLNGESPQFTLTCISTGGPATTVTWTRDSMPLDGGLTVLDNTMTAQYTHTLTVTGTLPGHYECTVSNNKPSTATRSFTVQGNLRIQYHMS